jgi:probable HAF family extracellular repeat protein
MSTTPRYRLTDLGALEVAEVSSTGQGRSHHLFGTEGDHHAVLWRTDGTMVDLGTLGGAESIARTTNDRGQIAGTADNAAGTKRAVLWQDGAVTDLGALGGATSGALGLNLHGQVVGMAETAGGEYHVFLWQFGTMYDLNKLVENLPPGWRVGSTDPSEPWAENEAAAFNDHGQVAATAELPGKSSRAVLLTPIVGQA